MSDRAPGLQRALEAVERRDFPAAYAVYEALLADHPDDAEVLREYGRAKYREYFDLQGAARLFERAQAADPRSVETLLWLGDLYAMGYGRGYVAAVDVYRRAIELDPEAVDAYIGLGLLHRAPAKPVTLDEAIAAFRQAVTIDPRRADGHLNLGAALVEAGRRDLAAEELRLAQQLLTAAGETRQARGIQRLLERLPANQPIESFAFSYQSPRYR
jgi:tetratricopeptide (TPR) repeat protein